MEITTRTLNQDEMLPLCMEPTGDETCSTTELIEWISERIFRLRHFQRTGAEVEELLRHAGFQQFERHEIPMKIFPIRIAA